jgi:restriction system protein
MERVTATRNTCLYCDTELRRDREDEDKAALYDMMNYGWSDNFTTRSHARAGVCPSCGWWRFAQSTDVGGRGSFNYDVRVAVLKTLDDYDSLSLAEIRQYLTARPESRFEIDPRKFEEVVADIFRHLGYSVILTSYSGDNGIDVILSGRDGATIGIQVKRYRNSIKVDKIRELTGALVIGGHTKGIFVTTSTFQAGAQRVVDLSSIRGYPIELIDGERLYEYLKITLLTSPDEIMERKPWGYIPEWH